MAVKGPQLDSLGSNVSTAAGSSQPSGVSSNPSADPSTANPLGGVTPTTPVAQAGGPSLQGETTLQATMDNVLDGDNFIREMDNLGDDQPSAFDNVATEMQANVDRTLEVIGTSETGQAMQIAGTGLTTAGGIVTAATGVETFGIGAVIGLAISAVGAGVGGIGTMMENDAKNFANDAKGLLSGQVDDFVKVAQNHKEQGDVLDLALGEEKTVVTEKSAVV